MNKQAPRISRDVRVCDLKSTLATRDRDLKELE